jgi:hypothetical protein
MGVQKPASGKPAFSISKERLLTKRDTDPATSVARATGVEKENVRPERAGYGPLSFKKTGPTHKDTTPHISELKVISNSPPHEGTSPAHQKESTNVKPRLRPISERNGSEKP